MFHTWKSSQNLQRNKIGISNNWRINKGSCTSEYRITLRVAMKMHDEDVILPDKLEKLNDDLDHEEDQNNLSQQIIKDEDEEDEDDKE